ncbi:MAG: DUF2269 domain-containing protein [Leptospiraceae bacterium]|nr:DUF2269 domain-containing protein [Leptospiraceae bacterium]
MTLYLLLKTIHILSAVAMFGAGGATALVKFMSDRQANLRIRHFINRHVVKADLWITTPSVLLQPITGLWLFDLMGLPWSSTWILVSLVLFVIAGVCWLPAVWLQLRMRDLTAQALESGSDLPPHYDAYVRLWVLLGIPAFLAMFAIVALMVFKPA